MLPAGEFGYFLSVSSYFATTSSIGVRPSTRTARQPANHRAGLAFAVITTHSNELVRAIHDRMPVIIPPESYDRWPSTLDADPRDLLVPYPAGPMTMWPISTRVNKPENDEASSLDRVAQPVGIIAK